MNILSFPRAFKRSVSYIGSLGMNGNMSVNSVNVDVSVYGFDPTRTIIINGMTLVAPGGTGSFGARLLSTSNLTITYVSNVSATLTYGIIFLEFYNRPVTPIQYIPCTANDVTISAVSNINGPIVALTGCHWGSYTGVERNMPYLTSTTNLHWYTGFSGYTSASYAVIGDF